MGKDVSVGEFDPATGLTHITQQRGRLLFNMGASVKKHKAQQGAPSVVAAAKATPSTSTGSFTGLSLYPEEAHYLLRRGALAIFLAPLDGEEPDELTVAGFTAMLAQDACVSLACVEVYTSLKDQKLHPRRSLNQDGRIVPLHFKEGHACAAAFDVWKAVAAEHPVSEGEEVGKVKKKQRKTLMMVFRVVVCRFGDAAPSPRSLRQAVEGSGARDGDGAAVPVKLAVVHHDQSVLLFEVSNAVPNELQHEQAR
jgi:hypothetical protein